MRFPQVIFSLLASACLVSGLAGAGDNAVPVAEITGGPAAKGLPSEAGWGYWEAAPDAWLQTHEGFVARSRRGGVDVVFLGDSITQGWKAIPATNWAGTTPAPTAVNYGIGGDGTRQLIWRIEHGTLDGIDPRLVVLMIGTNNLYRDQNSGTNEEIADGVGRVLASIREKAPRAKILLLGVLPRQTRPWNVRIAELNTLIARHEQAGVVRYLDAGAPFLDETGRVRAELYQKDGVHLNAGGYEILLSLVEPATRELLR